MSRRRELDLHLETLGEIREIMAAMKNLSFMESRKLTKFIDAQRQAVQTIERASVDFLRFHPDLLAAPKTGQVLFLIVGSERGFCGDYNEILIQRVIDQCQQLQCQPLWLIVGSKLADKLEQDPRVIGRLTGASVAEEVPVLLQQVVETLDELERSRGIQRVTAAYHDGDQLTLKSLLPPFQELAIPVANHAGPPLLYLPAAQFMAELTDHYLFAALHSLFYSALLAEHQGRVQHLEGALRRLDEQQEQLKVRRNVLRQEEITEEIEMILLSAQALAESIG